MTTSSTCQRNIDTAELEAVLANIDELPTIPETLINILNVIDDPNSEASDLAAAVRRDPPLMAKILKLANSPYYSPRGDIGDINRCVAVLGYRTVQQVAICVSVATVLVKAVTESEKEKEKELDYRELWRHSVVTGAIAKHLARITGYPDPEVIFTAGLLHDIGKFILELHAPSVYSTVVRGRTSKQCPLVDVEFETFGFDHANLAEAFARSWRFPELLARSFGSHHNEVIRDGGDNPFWHEAALVSLADYLANTIEPPRSDLGFDPVHVNAHALHLAANVTIESVEDNLDAIRESIVNASSYLNIS